MKLLVGTHYFDTHRGGVEIVARHLAEALVTHEGFTVTWMASDASAAPDGFPGELVALRCWNGVERRYGIPIPLPTPAAIRRIRDAVARCDAVLLHDSLYPTNVLACAFARRLRKPVVVVQHVGAVPYRNRLVRGLMQLGNRLVAAPVLRAADRVVFISGLTANYFRTRVNFRGTPVVIFNGLRTDLPPRESLPSRREAREALGLPADRYVALFVGRFVEKKGLAVLRALAQAVPDVEWAFCGWGPMDPSTWQLPNVHALGSLSGPALARAYRAADALVLPSVGEGLPLVVQEALAMGTAVVGSPDLVVADPWLEGRIVTAEVAHDDVAATVEAWRQAIERERRAGIARPDPAGATRERYAWSSAARAYASLVRELVRPAAGNGLDR